MPIATNDVFATGYVYDVKALEHVNKDQNVEEHPEIPERIEKIHSILKKKGYLDRMVHIPSRMAEDSELLYAHTKEHIEFLKKTRTMKKDKLDALVSKLDSIYMNNKSEQVARLSCGGAIDLCKSIWDGKIQNGVAIIRPPGHHAEANRARGFCLYNNVAVAARCLQRKRDAKKIMILDWDIHHGNGIQDIFYDDPDILYISIHRYDGGKFYPFAKDADMNFVGTGNAIGRNINIPWPCGGMGDSEYMYTFFKLIMPIAFEFSPDMVIISAGFDASKDDLLGGCKVSPECFAHMTHMLKSLGGGKLALILEGGYNVDATAVAMSACVGALLNESLPRLKSVVPIDCAYETIQEVLKVQSRYWSSIAPIYMKPSNEIKLRNKYSKITLSDLIKEHRRNKLYKEYNLIPLPINNDKLSESFKGDIMTSPQALVHEGFLYVFIHNSSDVRVEMNSFENLAESDKSYVFDFGLSYLKEIIPSVTDIASNKYTKKSENAIIEVVINYYEMLKNDRKQATEGIIKYIWDNYIESSLAGKNGKVILIVTGDSVSYISSLIMDRDVEKSVLGTVLFPWIEGPPHISSRKSKWYLNSSLVAIPHLLPPRTKIPTSPQYGHCISYGNDMLDSNEAPIKLQSVVMNFIESKKEEYWRNHRTEYNIFRKNEKVYNDSSISLLNKIDSMNIDLSMLDSSNSLVENVIDLTINEQRNKKIKISQNEHIDISTSDTVLSNNEMEHQGELEHDHFSKHKNKIESKKRLHSNRESSSIIELFINKKETKIGTARIKAASLDLKPLTIDSSDSESDSDADIVEVVLNNKKEQSEKLQEHKIPPSQLFEIPLISSHNKSTQIIHSLEKTPKNKYNKQNEKSESVLKPESSYLLSTNKDSYSKKENQLINTNKLSNASNISYTITYNKSSNMLNNSNNNKQTNQQADLLKTLAINKLSNTLSTTNINNIQNSLNHSVINKQSNIPQTILNSLNTNKQPNTIDKSMNILNSENTNELSNTLKSSNITKPLNTINSSTINKSLNFTNNKSSQVSDNSNVNIQTSAFNGLSFNKTLLNTFEVSENEDLIKRKVSNFNPNNASPILNINESSSNMMNKDYIHNNSNIYTDIIKSAISGFSNSSNLSNSSSISGDKTFTIDKNNNDDSNINNSNKNNDNNSNRNNNSSETFYGNINSNNNYNGNNSNNNNWNNNRYYDNLT